MAYRAFSGVIDQFLACILANKLLYGPKFKQERSFLCPFPLSFSYLFLFLIFCVEFKTIGRWQAVSFTKISAKRNVPPREASSTTKSEEKRVFSQATLERVAIFSHAFLSK